MNCFVLLSSSNAGQKPLSKSFIHSLLGEGRVHPEQVASSSQGWDIETNNHSRSHSHLRAIKSHQLTCTSLDCGRKVEYLEGTHADTGRTCKLHTERSYLCHVMNPGLSSYEVTVLTTEPPCHPSQHIKFKKQRWPNFGIKSHMCPNCLVIILICSVCCV